MADGQDKTDGKGKPVLVKKPRRHPTARFQQAHATLWTVIFTLALLVVGAVVFSALAGARLPLPSSVTDRIERQINAGQSQLTAQLGKVSVGLTRRGVPTIWLDGVTLRHLDGERLAELGRVGTAFDPMALLEGRIAPRRLRMNGAQILLRRDMMGEFAFDMGGGGDVAMGGLAGVLDGLDKALSAPPFDQVQGVDLSDSVITIEDARSRRVWQVTGSTISMKRVGQGLDMSLFADVFNGSDTLATVQASVRTRSDDGRASLIIDIDNAEATDIALQSPVVSFFGLLDAPLSAAIRTTLDSRGMLETFAGTFEIGAGAVRPRADVPPIPFDAAKAYFTYEPRQRRLDFTEISAVSGAGRGGVSGHAYLRDLDDIGFPRAIVGQFELTRLAVTGETFLAKPVVIKNGHVDMRLRLAPFELEIGQLVLTDTSSGAPRQLRGKGLITAGADGYGVAVDISTDTLDVTRLLDLWPRPVAPKTRDWMDRNVPQGMLHDVEAALRFAPGDEKPQISTTFAFDHAVVQAIQGMPPITSGRGHGSILQNRLGIALDAGEMAPPGGGAPVQMGGSTMVVANTKIKPAYGEFTLATEGPLTSLLTVLNGPPLNILKASGRSPDLADGILRLVSDVALPMKKGNTPEDISFSGRGTLEALRTDTLVADRVIEADTLSVEVDRNRITIGGKATFDGIPFDGSWSQALSGPDRGIGQVVGALEVTTAGLVELDIALPEGFLSGRGTGDLVLDLVPDTPPTFRLTSNLSGLGLSVPAIGWSKPRGGTGSFEIAGALGQGPRIDTLKLAAAGLRADGDIDLDGRRFRSLDLRRVQVNDWLDAAVSIRSRGEGVPPSVSVRGGTVDIRKAQLGASDGGGGGNSGAARGPVDLTLDRLVITDTIALSNAQINLAAGRQMSGEFVGEVNGGTRVQGQLIGSRAGTSIRLVSNDAGAVLRDAGLFRRVEGGRLELDLAATGQRGTYEGEVKVTGPRLREAPAVASLLNAISVVGLVEQLQTGGIAFDEVEASFRLSPRQITLYQSSAVGSSLGLSMDGVYDPARRRMDMQGVVSPFYLVNSIGSIFTRRGEGLVGISFTLRGPANRPSVGVNPLSVFTPGMFREIFRRPPPQRVGQAPSQ